MNEKCHFYEQLLIAGSCLLLNLSTLTPQQMLINSSRRSFMKLQIIWRQMPWLRIMRTFCHLISCWLYQTKFLIAGKIQQNKILTFFKNCMENRKYKSDIFLVRPHLCLLVGISTRNVFIKVQRCRRSFRLALVYLKASRPSQPCYKRQDIECFLSKYSWCWF